MITIKMVPQKTEQKHLTAYHSALIIISAGSFNHCSFSIHHEKSFFVEANYEKNCLINCDFSRGKIFNIIALYNLIIINFILEK